MRTLVTVSVLGLVEQGGYELVCVVVHNVERHHRPPIGLRWTDGTPTQMTLVRAVVGGFSDGNGHRSPHRDGGQPSSERTMNTHFAAL